MSALVLEKEINLPVDKVWKVLTDNSEMKHWYFDIPNFDLKIDSTFTFYEPGGKNQYIHECKILEIIPEKKLEHTWAHPRQSKGTSILIWDLQQNNDKTLVTLTHEGLENFSDVGDDFKPENYHTGWTAILQNLKDYLEQNPIH